MLMFYEVYGIMGNFYFLFLEFSEVLKSGEKLTKVTKRKSYF